MRTTEPSEKTSPRSRFEWTEPIANIICRIGDSAKGGESLHGTVMEGRGSIRIGHNIDAVTAHRHALGASGRLEQSMQRLSSGLRINSARDDAAGLGISEKLRGQIRGLEQAGRNIQDGISLLQTMEGVLSEVHSILQRARELAVQRNNGVLNTQAKNAIKSEFLALCAEIGRIEGSTQFNGIPLLQNASAILTLQVGANDGETITISLVDLIGGTAGSLVRPNTFFTVSWNDADLAGFDLHIDDVSTARGRLGAVQNRLEHALAANDQKREILLGAESRIRDVDVAAEMTSYVRSKILQQGATAMMAQANQAPRHILSLLR